MLTIRGRGSFHMVQRNERNASIKLGYVQGELDFETLDF